MEKGLVIQRNNLFIVEIFDDVKRFDFESKPLSGFC